MSIVRMSGRASFALHTGLPYGRAEPPQALGAVAVVDLSHGERDVQDGSATDDEADLGNGVGRTAAAHDRYHDHVGQVIAPPRDEAAHGAGKSLSPDGGHQHHRVEVPGQRAVVPNLRTASQQGIEQTAQVPEGASARSGLPDLGDFPALLIAQELCQAARSSRIGIADDENFGHAVFAALKRDQCRSQRLRLPCAESRHERVRARSAVKRRIEVSCRRATRPDGRRASAPPAAASAPAAAPASPPDPAHRPTPFDRVA